jgi:hypothetical protein
MIYHTPGEQANHYTTDAGWENIVHFALDNNHSLTHPKLVNVTFREMNVNFNNKYIS